MRFCIFSLSLTSLSRNTRDTMLSRSIPGTEQHPGKAYRTQGTTWYGSVGTLQGLLRMSLIFLPVTAVNGMPAWTPNMSSELLPQYGLAIMRSNRWPGAVAFAKDRYGTRESKNDMQLVCKLSLPNNYIWFDLLLYSFLVL